MLLAFFAAIMKTRNKDWFGKSDVGIYAEMRVRRFGREAHAV